MSKIHSYTKSILQKLLPASPPKYMLLILIVFGCFSWLVTQHLILQKGAPECGIWDELHNWTLWFNAYCHNHPTLTNLILVFSTLWIDVGAWILFLSALFRSGSRPLISIGLFFLLRQILQFLVSLPIPPEIIWHDPGFPTILVTYTTSNDLYFSSHTGVALLAAMELARMGKKFLTAFGFFMLFFEIWTVLAFQMHYTMDVYTAVITVFLTSWIANRVAPKFDQALCTLDSWIRK